MNLTEYKLLTKTVKTKSKQRHPEYEEQKQVIKWWRGLRDCKAIPGNYHLICTDTAAKRTKMQQVRYKAMGGEAGVADLFLSVPRGIYNGLFIEMKDPDRKAKTDRGKGGVSPEQFVFLADMEDLGYVSAVCYSAEEAQKVICNYLGLAL